MSDKKIRINKIEVESKEQLNELYKGSAFTIEGFDTSTKNINKLVEWFEKYGGINNPLNLFIIKGSVMNSEYGLTGDNAYPQDLNIISIKLENIKDVMKIVIPRFSIGGRWFDDIVNNNSHAQNTIAESDEEEEN